MLVEFIVPDIIITPSPPSTPPPVKKNRCRKYKIKKPTEKEREDKDIICESEIIVETYNISDCYDGDISENIKLEDICKKCDEYVSVLR